MSIIEQFEKRYIPENFGCWLWIGALRPRGYGSFRVDGKSEGAHRFSWEHHNKARIPEGMYVCHTCDNPCCVNPDHLWIGTSSDNMIDASKKGRLASRMHWNALKTHCPNGHEYNGVNLRMEPRGRRCRTCNMEWKRQKRARIRALAAPAVVKG